MPFDLLARADSARFADHATTNKINEGLCQRGRPGAPSRDCATPEFFKANPDEANANVPSRLTFVQRRKIARRIKFHLFRLTDEVEVILGPDIFFVRFGYLHRRQR